jgi:GT2 family glycosyltransferase
MGASADLSVVICTCAGDRWDDLLAAIASVRIQSLSPRDIVVVVDHNPALLDRLAASAVDVVVVENTGAAGLSVARNCGVAAARGAIIAFLDDDALAPPDWLEHLALGYADARVMGTGGPVQPVWQGGRPRWFPREFDWVVGCTFQGMPASTAPVQRLIGCNMSFRRDVFEAVGGFRAGIGRVASRPVAGEETELCIRARQHWPHRVFLYEPRARVHHRVPPARARWRYFGARCFGEGLSKALIARCVGARDGLASERAYVWCTLPRGVARGAADTFLHADPAGLARAGTIAAGLTLTAAGYARGALTLSRSSRPGRPPAVRALGTRANAWPAQPSARATAVE